MKWNMATLIWTCRSLSGTFKFYPSHTKNSFFRCYRPSLTKNIFFVSFYPSQISLRKFWLSRIGFSFENKKVMIEKVILYRLSRVCFLCVTWQAKEVLIQNWLLKMLKLFFNVISICHEGPRKSITTTSEVCFKANSHNTVWNVTHN